MPRRPTPWFRKERQAWFVNVGGKQVNLGPDKEQAYKRFYELMALPKVAPAPLPSEAVVVLIDKFLDWVQEHQAPRTYEWYQWRLQEFAKSIDRSLTAGKLRPYHLDEWLKGHPEWKSGTKHGMARAVMRMMRWSKKRGYIDKNPIEHYEKPKAGKRSQVIAPKEFQKILGVVPSQEFRDLLEVTWETGCRPQESLVVEARHVDLQHSRWVFPPEESKGEEWPRIVYLTDPALDITKRLMKEHPDGPLFRNTEGRPWTTDAVNCAFNRVETKLGKKYCLYVIRHSWATHALTNGTDALTVAILLGHRDPSTLARTYQHLTQNPEYLKEAVRNAVKP